MSIDVRARLEQLANTEWPATGMETLGGCPVCGGRARKTLYRDMLDVTFFCAPGRWVLHQCDDCRSAYLDPRPAESAIGLAYECYYTHSTPLCVAAETLGPLRRIRRAVANDYRNWRFGATLTPRVVGGRYLVRAIPTFRSSLERGGRYLPRLERGGAVLDVGSGNGEFLDDASALGWRATGVEPDPVAAAACVARGHAIFSGVDEIEGADLGPFDAITLSHVIEHVHRPREFLKHLCGLLTPDGALFIETPNVEALGHRRFGRHWRGLEVPRHLCLFSWLGLEQLLRECGLTDIDRYPTVRDYPSLATRSRTIREGRDPAAVARGGMSERLQAIRAALAVGTDFQNSEFITLIARRPG